MNDGFNGYGYNAESEIKSAAGVNYTYDGDGNRVEKSSGKIYWYGAGTEILDESDTSGNFTNEYVFFGGKRVAMRTVSSGTVYYYASDMLGSARTMVQAGQSSLCYDGDFLPYGQEVDYAGTCGSNYRFEGKERDLETGDDDFGARYYRSALGRWLSADWSAVPAPVPYANLTNPQTLNLYAMVSDNPETFADLDGHTCTYGPLGQENCKDTANSNANAPATTGEGHNAPDPQKNGTNTPTPPTPAAQQQNTGQSQSNQQSSSSSGRVDSPSSGDPDTTVRIPKPGGGYTGRTYGPDGRAVKDIDSGHDHGPGDPHAHDWDWKKNPPREKVGRPLTPEERNNLKKVAVGVGAVGVVGVIHTIIATAPEWGPWVLGGLAF